MSAIAHEMMFALVCLSSTLGHVIQAPGWKSDVFRHMLVRHPYDRVAIHGVETAIRTHGTELGRLRVDYAVAALAIDALELVNNWSPNIEADTFAFYLEAAEPDAYARTIVANSLDSCTHVVATHILFCTRAPLSPAVFDVETEEFPAVFAFAHFGHRDRYGENGRLVIRRHLFSWLGAIPPGSYELVVHGAGAASLDLMGGPKLPLPTIETASGRDTLRVSFEVSPNDQVAFDIATTETTGFAVASAQLRLRKPISPGE